jgi:hypothetical protein
MTSEDALQELIQVLGSKRDETILWEQVCKWPKGTLEIFQDAGWIIPKAPAKSVVCPGCEENCFMPVHVFPTVQGKPMRAFVACDKRDDMGNIPIPLDTLQQWQVTEGQVAQWIANELGLKGKPKKNKTTRTMQVGEIQGKNQSGRLELVSMEPVSLKASGHFLALNEIVYFENKGIKIDQGAILNIVDRSPPSERYQPSNARRETRKLDTQEMYKSWQKAYRKIKRERRNMSDVWYSQQIAKMDIAQKRNAETIRKEMKK